MPQRLKGQRFYLCGSIESDQNCNVWRNDIKDFLKPLGIIVLDPLDKPIQEGLETVEYKQKLFQLRQNNKFDELKQYKSIRLIDLRLVDISDVIIFYLNLNITTVGSWEEVFLANRSKKPILTACPQGKQNIPLWLFWTIPHQHMFGTLDELEKYLHKVNSDPLFKDETNRWRFFNL